MKILTKKDLIQLINEEINLINCSQIKLNQETINYVNKFKSSEELLRSGGLPIEILDRLAYGFSNDDIKTLTPNQLNIKWKDDLENVMYEQQKSGLSKIDYAKRINLSEPIDVIYEKDKFWVDDGHHRYYAAKILNKLLNINLEIKQNPIIKLSQSNIEFKTRIQDFNIIDCIRIIPKIGYCVIEVVYTIKEKEQLLNNNRYISIDLGVNNLATITSNIKEIKPIIINGKPLKSINQYYNKKRSNIQSILEIRNKKYNSNNLNLLTLKRKNKIDNYLHKASKYIIKQCILNNINTIIIGKNDSWKQESKMNKQNNQNFINIPHSRFIEMIRYKCEIEGINITTNEESYTSKASFLDLDDIPKYIKGNNKENYIFTGKRISRGLYRSKSGKLINADVNGSYNILRKAIPNVFNNGIEGIRVYPEIIKISKK